MAITTEHPLANRPLYMQKKDPGDPDIVYTGANFRRYTQALIPRPGILTSTSFKISQSNNVGFTVMVQPGSAVVGDYMVTLDGGIDGLALGMPTGPPATRVHRIWLAVYDKNFAGTTYQASIVITEDDGTGSQAPVNCVAYLQLARVTYKAGMPNVQDKDIVNVQYHGGMSDREYTWFQQVGVIIPPFQDNVGSGTAEARAIYTNGYVRLSGSIRRQNGDPIVANPGVTIGNMPAALRPKFTVHMAVTTTIDGGDGAPYVGRLRIEPDGTMYLNLSANQKPQAIILDGCSYDLD